MNTKLIGPTERQIEALYKILDPHSWPSIKTMSKLQAWQLIHDHSLTWRTQPATEKQQRFLQTQKQWTDGMLKGEAKDSIGRILDQKEEKHKEKHTSAPSSQPTATALDNNHPADDQGHDSTLGAPLDSAVNNHAIGDANLAEKRT